jgi:hypothetical protein
MDYDARHKVLQSLTPAQRAACDLAEKETARWMDQLDLTPTERAAAHRICEKIVALAEKLYLEELRTGPLRPITVQAAFAGFLKLTELAPRLEKPADGDRSAG